MPFNDRELLARILQCEAGGEGEDGMRAVATVIMNRVHVADGEYARTGGGSLRNVIYQPYQFDCARTEIGGQYNPQNIYNMSPEQIHYDIADWALEGNRFTPVGESLWYYNPFSPTCEQNFPRSGSGYLFNRINQHCFYAPTSLYYST
ncbi:MAG: cell wall hydrolase [Candidatus Howiella sp.]